MRRVGNVIKFIYLFLANHGTPVVSGEVGRCFPAHDDASYGRSRPFDGLFDGFMNRVLVGRLLAVPAIAICSLAPPQHIRHGPSHELAKP